MIGPRLDDQDEHMSKDVICFCMVVIPVGCLFLILGTAAYFLLRN